MLLCLSNGMLLPTGQAEFYKGHNTTRLMEGLDDLAFHYSTKQNKLNGALMQQYNSGLTSGIGRYLCDPFF